MEVSSLSLPYAMGTNMAVEAVSKWAKQCVKGRRKCN